MKRQVIIPHFGGGCTKATIVINKDGLSVIDKSDFCTDSGVCGAYITQLIDYDQWKHSYHINVQRAQSKSSDERKKIRGILLEKIAQREQEIQDLKDGLQILGRWNYTVS